MVTPTSQPAWPDYSANAVLGSVAVVGLATDVCVAATAVSAATAGFGTVVLWDATRPVASDANTTERVLADLAAAGVTVIGAPS